MASFRFALALLLLILPSMAAPHAGAHASKHKAYRLPRRAPTVVWDAAAVNDAANVPEIGPGSKGAPVLLAQLLLARAHFSSGEIDGYWGANLARAAGAYQAAHGIREPDKVGPATWAALNADSGPVLQIYSIAPEDVAGPFEPVPETMMEKAKLKALGYASPLEGLAEKFHSSPKLLLQLNPGKAFDQAGEPILVPNAFAAVQGKAASVVVSKSDRSVKALDAEGKILAYYPATIGSEHDPLPIGTWKVRGVQKNPRFHYNPDLFWDAEKTDSKATIAAGPNNPVGTVWIDLSKPHYGIHGTPEPSTISKTQSHGCIRLTNWDAWELAHMVGPGTPAILEE